ncbi:hypothetical protein BC830DRAFT_1126533, partial [Chytriomyces sp. MP71]
MSGKPVRRGGKMSERRAEQNRRAQAAFRERKKERIRQLEALASVATGGGVSAEAMPSSPETVDDDLLLLRSRVAELEATLATIRNDCICLQHSGTLQTSSLISLPAGPLDPMVVHDLTACRTAILALPTFAPSPTTGPAVALAAHLISLLAEYFSCAPDGIPSLWLRLVKVRNRLLDGAILQDRAAILELLDIFKLKYNILTGFPSDSEFGVLVSSSNPGTHTNSSDNTNNTLSANISSSKGSSIDNTAYGVIKNAVLDEVSNLQSFKRVENTLIAANALIELTSLFETQMHLTEESSDQRSMLRMIQLITVLKGLCDEEDRKKLDRI